MKSYDVYGIVGGDLEAARHVVEIALGFRFSAHESGFHCGEYYRYNDVGQEHFILQKNYDDVEAEWTEPEHQDQPFLLYVNETSSSDGLRQKLEVVSGITLIRHEEI